MVASQPYLPDIMEGVVARVNQTFSTRAQDPFNVYFAKGIHGQVSREMYSQPNNYPLVWLVMNYPEIRGKDFSIYGVVTCMLLILAPTDSKYTQQQRDDLVFGPRLLPVYDLLMAEIGRERWFQFPGSGSIEHTKQIKPYWGGGDVNGADMPNLFKKQVDAIAITGLKLRVKLNNCNSSGYSLLQVPNYPPIPQILVFEGDIELIVDGGQSTDPVDGQSSVSIPSLAGKQYSVIQRNFGKLRNQRQIEVQDDPDGGFSLLQGYAFKSGDTYVVEIRPRVVSDVTGMSGTLSRVDKVFMETNS